MAGRSAFAFVVPMDLTSTLKVSRIGLLFASFFLLRVASSLLHAAASEPADLILTNGKVWTVDDRQPVAQAVALRGTMIEKVGTDAEVLALKGASTQVIDLQGRLVLPGFNDAHTHFENAVDWFFQVLLMDVNDQPELLHRLTAASARVPKGIWITGGDWGSFALWAASKKGDPAFQAFKPELAAIDAVTPDHPVLLRRYQHDYFANSRALRLAGITEVTADPRGGRYERDPKTGKLTGMLYGTAGEQMEKLLPPPSRLQKLIGARGVLQELNRVGITSIHDIARLDDISQLHQYPTYAERSHTDVAIFRDLQKRGELTARVYAFMPLTTWSELAHYGIHPGSGDEFIRYGILKEFVDGSLMFAPIVPGSKSSGSFTFRYVDEPTMQRNVTAADKGGYDLGFHVLGDKALNYLLNWYEKAIGENGPRERRFRLIHAWYATMPDLERAGRMHVIADVTPHQLLDQDVVALDRNLGPERAKTAFAWRTMIQQGIRVNLVSDLPGLFNKTDVSPFDPLEIIYSAITRKDPKGNPAGGWHPEQCLTIQEAIQAYTINPAFSSREEGIKGSITEGKLGDLVVLSKDILTIPPEEILTTHVEYTIFGGKIIYRKNAEKGLCGNGEESRGQHDAEGCRLFSDGSDKGPHCHWGETPKPNSWTSKRSSASLSKRR